MGVDWGDRKLSAGLVYMQRYRGATWGQDERRVAEDTLKTPEISKAVDTGEMGVSQGLTPASFRILIEWMESGDT